MEEAHIQKFYRMIFADVYPLYLQKVEKKGRSESELRAVITWLTGYDESGIEKQIALRSSFEQFFANAPLLNPKAIEIKGMICGYRVEDIEEPLVKKCRYLDKIIDELAKGKALEKIFRN